MADGPGRHVIPLGWHRRRLAVCASTENELERWLRQQPLPPRRLVVARRQRCGHGQQGRVWQSPAGGLWLSAAFPWPRELAGRAALPLALALGLALELEALAVPVAIKWPNDLLVHGRKLAGLLPRLRLRGNQVRWAQVGLGINGINRVPAGAIALAEALQQRPRRDRSHGHFDPRATPRRLEPLALRAIERAMGMAPEPELVRLAVERRLWRPAEGLERGGQRWRITGLEVDGGLQVQGPGGCCAVWRRDF
jgi:BirA family biotin operon repressor/biotin-[acetyl-CoA-carboxylase] ligase